MLGASEFRRLCYARLKTVRVLIKAEDWEAAAYMMGYVLETMLKASACKALHLKQYPDTKSNHDGKVISFFMTHRLDMLLTVSGLSDLFLPALPGADDNITFNWSQFTSSYQGDWPSMRYRPDLIKDFPPEQVRELYDYLFESPDSIIKTVRKAKRW